MGFNSGFKGLKYSVLIFVEKNIYKMQHLEGSGTPRPIYRTHGS